MAQLSHEMPEDGFHEIQLSGKQLVFLFMAATVASVMIFLLGVLVGRSVPYDRGPDDLPIATAVPAAQPELIADASPLPEEPPAPQADADELSYKKRLEGDATPPEVLRPRAEPTPARPGPVPAERRQPDPAPARVAEATPAPAAAQGGGEPRPGVWVVQLVALRDKSAAASIAQRLSGKGYPAFVAAPAAGAPVPMYRVQVGRYADRREAEQVARRLEKEEQFQPWISR